MAAKTLRDEGFRGELYMVDPHSEEPIDRTMLTKMALTDSSPLKRLRLHDLNDLNVVRIKDAVKFLQSKRAEMSLRSGRTLRFDAALIATGGIPKHIPMQGEEKVFSIRHVDDLRRLRSSARRGRHAVIVGTSFIGMEAASALRQRGLKVTVIGRDDLPFEDQLGSPVAKALLSLHKRKGVNFILGAQLLQIAPRHVIVEKHGRHKEVIGDLVIVGVGVAPTLSFTHDLPIAADGGILTDRSLRASESVWVAGDIANVEGVRIEHWRVAQQQGMHAAMQMLGRHKPLRIVPFFWTYHFGKRFNYLGHAQKWTDISIVGDLRQLNFLALLSARGAVQAVVSCQRETETALLAELMRKRLPTKTALGALSRPSMVCP